VNVGAGQIGVQLAVEIEGVSPDVIMLPMDSVAPGGVRNPDRDIDEPALQDPDRLVFTMVPGRGRGLSYRLVVRDLLRYVIRVCVLYRVPSCARRVRVFPPLSPHGAAVLNNVALAVMWRSVQTRCRSASRTHRSEMW
jgi:hypothetical protein